MNSDMELTLRLTADGRAMITTVNKAEKALDGLGGSADVATGKISKTRRGVESISKQLERYNQLVKWASGLTAAAFAVSGLINIADDAKLMNARLLQATGSQAAFNAAQSEAQRIAQDARADYESTVNLLSRLTFAADQFNIEQSKIAATTEAVTYGLKLYGASAAEVTSVQTQLSQALASGVLAGDEFKSMAEASPRLMQALADGLGVARGELKQLAAEGELTTERVINALAGQAEVLQTEFAGMPVTVAEGWGQLMNVATQGMAWLDSSTGLSEALAQALLFVSANLGNLTQGFLVAAGAAAAFYAVQKIGTLLLAASQMIALEKALGGVGTRAAISAVFMKHLGLSAGTAAVGMRGLTAAIAANPIGLIVTGLSIAIGYLVGFRHEIHPVADSIASLGDYAQVAFSYIRGVIGRAIGWLQSLFNGWTNIGNAIAGLLGVSNETFEAISKVLVSFGDAARFIINRYIGFWVGAYNAVVGIWKNFPAALRYVVSQAVNWALEKINRFVRGTAKVLNYIPGVEIDVSTIGFETIKVEGASAAASIKDAFVEGLNTDYIGKAFGKIESTFSSVSSSIKSNTKEIAEQWTELAEIEHFKNNDPFADMDNSATNLQSTLSKTRTDLDTTGNTAAGAGKKIKGMGSATKGAAQSLKQAQQELQQFTQSAVSLLGQLFPAKKLLNDMEKEANLLSRALTKDGIKALEAYGLSTDEVNGKLAELQSIIKGFKDGTISKAQAKNQFDDMKKGIASVKDEASDTANVLETQFKRAIESVDQSFADMWKTVLKDGKISFKSLADNLRNIFAEVLHGLTTKPLTQWISGIFSGKATMDSVTGEVKSDKTAQGIWDTLTSGFNQLDKTFSDGLQNLLGMEAQTAHVFGRILSGAGVGAGVGGMAAGMMGMDSGTGSLLGAAGGALGKWAGGKLGMMAGNMMGGATGVVTKMGSMFMSAMPVIGTILGAALGAVIGKIFRKRGKSRTWMTADGEETNHVTKKGFSAEATREPLSQFWSQTRAIAERYGVEFREGLNASFGLEERSKGIVYFFDLLTGNNQDIQNYELVGDDIKDPQKFADTMIKMQIAALKQADWSGVSQVVSSGFSLINPDDFDQKSGAELYQWIDSAKAAEAAYGDVMSEIFENLSYFTTENSTFEQYKAFTASLFELTKRYGKEAVDTLNAYFTSNKITAPAELTEIAESFNVFKNGIEALGQSVSVSGNALVGASKEVVKAMGGVEAATAIYKNIFAATATATEKAGMAYQSSREQVDMLNATMGLTGGSAITTTDQLRAYVASLDPLSAEYAKQMTWASNLSGALVSVAQAGKYFDDAISGIGATIDGVIGNIREDLMTDKELYASRKSQAEELAKSIATMTNVDEIKSAADEASKLVSNMWRSLTDEQQSSGMGDWMIAFLEEMETLAQGKIEKIQNEYGADNEIADDYTQIETAANSMIAVAEKQNEASDKMHTAASTMVGMVDLIQRAAQTMSAAADKINQPIDVDVTVQQIAVGGEIN